MKVWVIMGNDYPDAVFTNEESADTYCKLKSEETKKLFGEPRVYWRSYEFELMEKVS